MLHWNATLPRNFFLLDKMYTWEALCYTKRNRFCDHYFTLTVHCIWVVSINSRTYNDDTVRVLLCNLHCLLTYMKGSKYDYILIYTPAIQAQKVILRKYLSTVVHLLYCYGRASNDNEVQLLIKMYSEVTSKSESSIRTILYSPNLGLEAKSVLGKSGDLACSIPLFRIFSCIPSDRRRKFGVERRSHRKLKVKQY